MKVCVLNKEKMYKIANNIAPSYLINLFQMRNSLDDPIFNLRSVVNKNFLIAKPKLNLFKIRIVCRIRGYHLEQHSSRNRKKFQFAGYFCFLSYMMIQKLFAIIIIIIYLFM